VTAAARTGAVPADDRHPTCRTAGRGRRVLSGQGASTGTDFRSTVRSTVRAPLAQSVATA
jgi:hypothetical protein